jgi:hypothetical protein
MSHIIQGRPDMADRKFGITRAKKHLPYVYSTDVNGCLIHKVRYVELIWYEVETRDSLRRLDNPRIRITTKCGQTFFVGYRRRNTPIMCELPKVDAVLCGRCEGKAATFRKGKSSISERFAAHQKLGCLVEVEK